MAYASARVIAANVLGGELKACCTFGQNRVEHVMSGDDAGRRQHRQKFFILWHSTGKRYRGATRQHGLRVTGDGNEIQWH